MYENGIADLGRVTNIKKHKNRGYGKELVKQVINEVAKKQK